MIIQDNENKESKCKLSIKLSVIGALNLNDYKCRIFINGDLYKIISCDSLLMIPLGLSSKTMNLHFIREPKGQNVTSAVSEPLYIPEFNIKPQIGKVIVIEATINDSFFYYRPFNSELIKLYHNYIKFYNPDRKRYERIPKIADNSNIFSKFRLDP